ncbi:MAG TPA: NADPH:quinone oxidoreductase [Hyphomonas atlantica]|uniref:NADPH:quinone oxidoreductase n=1 Tax=Hyphomonas atlantica TaxID=1280948 RepID=A0A356W3Y0_9PROT|nr:NADPH:quinone oxidoreductase [Hyphomonas atlantica]HBQ47715.1 NADPH:quinone oxidoreductase [Hyphomonas atlantica]|tara:strand:+ start:1761 stop:2735 length:975 start_codon:yes stop_codon:yes gene_type:complete
MRALVCDTLTDDFSGLSLKDIPIPEVGKGEVLVRVSAASVNFPDLLMSQGKYQMKPELPFTQGMECAGIVEAVGEGVTEFAPGDRVVGGNKTGAFAEHAVLPAAGLSRVPETMELAEAAAYPAAYLTAYVALVRRANLQAGETLLVHGASGGVGMAAVDVGKLLGATVIATSASDKKLDTVLAHGADYVINVSQGFRDKVKTLTAGRGADVIFDPVGGDVFDESVRCIAFDGRLLVVGFTSGRIPEVKVNMPLIKGFSVVGVRAGEYGRRFPQRGKENMEAIWKWAAEGKTRPRIHAELPLEEWREAYRLLTDREVVGKVVLRP